MAKRGFDKAAFKRDLRDLRKQVQADARTAMNAGSGQLADEIRRNAPVDTGALRDSVKVSPVRSRRGTLRQSVSVGGADIRPHAAQVEYGTSDTPADPFIRRSILTTEPAIVRLVEAAIFPD